MTSTISHTAFDVNQKLPTALIAINNNNNRNNGGDNENGNRNGNKNCHNNDVSAINNSKFKLGGVKIWCCGGIEVQASQHQNLSLEVVKFDIRGIKVVAVPQTAGRLGFS